MKTGFNERNAIKNQRPKDKPIDGKNSPWDFTCPQYDQRTSCFLNAGTDYGIGMAQPIGHSGEAKQRVPTLPYGDVQTMRLHDKRY